MCRQEINHQIIVITIVQQYYTQTGTRVFKLWTGLLEWISGLTFNLKITPKNNLFAHTACSRKCRIAIMREALQNVQEISKRL